MTWLQALSNLLSAFSALIDWLKQKSQKKLGELEVANQNLKDEILILKKASDAREEARIAVDAVPEPDSLPDDGFRRD